MRSSVHKGKDFFILGEGPSQWLDDTTLIVEAVYPITFTQSSKRFVLIYTIMEAIASYLLMLQKYINSKWKFLK